MKTHHNHSVFAKMRWKGIHQNARTCEHLTLAVYKDSEKFALPETNIFSPLEIGLPKRKFIFQQGHYITNPNKALLRVDSLKTTIHLHWMIPPKWGNFKDP